MDRIKLWLLRAGLFGYWASEYSETTLFDSPLSKSDESAHSSALLTCSQANCWVRL